MPELLASSDAANRKLRELYARDLSGVNRKLRGLYARDTSGANRKIFSSFPSGISAQSIGQYYYHYTESDPSYSETVHRNGTIAEEENDILIYLYTNKVVDSTSHGDGEITAAYADLIFSDEISISAGEELFVFDLSRSQTRADHESGFKSMSISISDPVISQNVFSVGYFDTTDETQNNVIVTAPADCSFSRIHFSLSGAWDSDYSANAANCYVHLKQIGEELLAGKTIDPNVWDYNNNS